MNIKAVIGILMFSVSAAVAQTTPLHADQVADSICMNVHAEYLPPANTSVYSDPNYTNIIQAELLSSGIRCARVGAEAPPGDSQAHKDEFFARLKALKSGGINLTAVAPPILANMDADYNSVGGWAQVEGANEPDQAKLPCATILANQQTLYNFVKGDSLLKSLPVLGPSLTTTQPSVWLQTCATFAGKADIGNWHTYQQALYPEHPNNNAQYHTNTVRLYPGLLAYSGEFGYRSVQPGEVAGQNVVPGAPDPIIARYLTRYLLFAVKNGWNRTYIHQIADGDAPDPTRVNSGYGMIDYYGTVKPQWTAVKNLIAMFSDPTPFTPTPISVKVTGVAGGTFMVFQRSNGKYLIPIWLTQEGWDEKTYTLIPVMPEVVSVQLGTSAPSVEIHSFNDDGTVSVATTATVNGLFQMTITDHVQMVEF